MTGATAINREEDSFMRLAHDVVRALSASACGYFGVSSGKCSMCPASTRGTTCVRVMLDDAESRLRALEQQAERDRHDSCDAMELSARLSGLRNRVLSLDGMGDVRWLQERIEEGEY